jgi:putative transposase
LTDIQFRDRITTKYARAKKIKKAYKYRIYPTREQEIFFEKTFEYCRFVWNRMLAEKLSAYEKRELIPQITVAKYKEEFSFLKEVDSLALANVQLQLEKALKNRLRNPKQFGLPKFKRKRDKQSYTTNSVNGSIRVDFEKGVLYLPKIKDGIKIELHRTFEGQIKSATVSKTKDGKYYVSILVETEEARNKVMEPKSEVCGIDLGLEHFAIVTKDFGTYKVKHPKHLRWAEKRLKRLQKDLSRKQEGSKNYEKTKQRLGKLHAYISNARNDFLHKLSKAILNENQVVVVEEINVKGLMKLNVAKLILDSSWSKFLTYIRYKAEWYGRTFIQVAKFFPSSKLCHCCGYKKEDLALYERTWTCRVCGKDQDRDVNASINLYFVRLGRPEVKSLKHALVDDSIGIPKKPSCF